MRKFHFMVCFYQAWNLLFWALADENGARWSFSSLCLICLFFLNIFLARNPQLTPKIKDESEIEEIYNIKEELGRGTFGVVNRAEKDGKERMTLMTSSDLQWSLVVNRYIYIGQKFIHERNSLWKKWNAFGNNKGTGLRTILLDLISVYFVRFNSNVHKTNTFASMRPLSKDRMPNEKFQFYNS